MRADSVNARSTVDAKSMTNFSVRDDPAATSRRVSVTPLSLTFAAEEPGAAANERTCLPALTSRVTLGSAFTRLLLSAANCTSTATMTEEPEDEASVASVFTFIMLSLKRGCSRMRESPEEAAEDDEEEE